jgi:imidazoleglycerol phosphate dehydratase HisB
MRAGEIERTTKETRVKASVDLDGTGLAKVDTPVAFLGHMITSLSTHSLMDVEIKAEGDLRHHIVEDAAICLGQAIREAIGDGSSLRRFGSAMVPMDCSLASSAVDLSGRPYSVIDLKTEGLEIEDTPVEEIVHFLESLTVSLRANLHVRVEYGRNDHHKVEAAFKALALSLRQALSLDPRRSGVPSSKGVL